MSTKFSIRPAPRKRPWICKRSPPCLVPPPTPPSLIASFTLQRHTPPGFGPRISGSTTLIWMPGPGHFAGSWRDGPNSWACQFRYDLANATGAAQGQWITALVNDFGNYPKIAIPVHPKLEYHVYSVTAWNFTWLAELQITG